jgi:SAM-dependent methyltransferase
MRESSKSSAYWSPREREALAGRVLDIGAGSDPVTPGAVRFDLADGDANRITAFAPASFDCVYSSHCLEHMHDPAASLRNWWSLVKPAGFLFLIVPDEDLYEQGLFPSRFNSDHKHTFTIGKKRSWSPRSVNLYELCAGLEGAAIETIQLNDIGYDRRVAGHSGVGPEGRTHRRLARMYRSLRKRGLVWRSLAFERWMARTGGWDQTAADALAQIEVIVRKR